MNELENNPWKSLDLQEYNLLYQHFPRAEVFATMAHRRPYSMLELFEEIVDDEVLNDLIANIPEENLWISVDKRMHITLNKRRIYQLFAIESRIQGLQHNSLAIRSK